MNRRRVFRVLVFAAAAVVALPLGALTPQRRTILFAQQPLNLRAVPGLQAWYDLSDPAGYLSSTAQFAGAGTVTCTLISTAFAGSGTAFGPELAAGDSVYNAGGTFVGKILSVTNNTTATLTANAAVAITAAAFNVMRANSRVLPLDKSGLGHNLLQATPAKQPTLIGGLLVFPGTGYVQASFALAQPLMFYAVMRQNTGWANGNIIIDGIDGTHRNIVAQHGSSPTIELAPTDVAANGNLPLNTLALVRAYFSGAASFLGVNRTAVTTGNPGTQASNGITIGAANAGGASPAMSLGELAVFSALPAQDAQIINAEIAKWHVTP